MQEHPKYVPTPERRNEEKKIGGPLLLLSSHGVEERPFRDFSLFCFKALKCYEFGTFFQYL
jgi:hypothetical protein